MTEIMDLLSKFEIKEHEKNPTGLAHSTEKLRQMLLENPDLPLVVMAGEDANIGDYGLMMCSSIKCEVGELLDCDQHYSDRVFTDRSSFEEVIADSIIDKDTEKLTDKAYDELVNGIASQYELYWKKCILLTVNN